jgi:hypothetical protein
VFWLAGCYVVDCIFSIILISLASSLLHRRAFDTYLRESQELLVQTDPPLDQLELTHLKASNERAVTREKTTCAICFEDFEVGERVLTLPGCQHQFHSHCISHWLLVKPQCPCCNSNVRDALRAS